MMREQLREYHLFLKQLVELQKKLITVFEETVEIDPTVVKRLEEVTKNDARGSEWKRMAAKLQSNRTVSEIVAELWLEGLPRIPMTVWLKPRTGLMQFEGDHWLFQMHGSNEVLFQRLPSGLDTETLAELQKGKIEVLANVLETVGTANPDPLPHIDVTYLEKGRTDGVRAWAAYLYAASINAKLGHIDENDHEDLMEELVQAGVCEVVPGGAGLHVALAGP
jgi:hypothetical protein